MSIIRVEVIEVIMWDIEFNWIKNNLFIIKCISIYLQFRRIMVMITAGITLQQMKDKFCGYGKPSKWG